MVVEGNLQDHSSWGGNQLVGKLSVVVGKLSVVVDKTQEDQQHQKEADGVFHLLEHVHHQLEDNNPLQNQLPKASIKFFTECC